MVNQHSIALRQHSKDIQQLISFAQNICHKLNSFIYSIQTHFLHTSISDLLANRLNLRFIHPKDLPNILNSMHETANISFTTRPTPIPLVDLVTRLLTQQRIDFIPLNNSSDSTVPIIGSLSISSFFAVTADQHQSFFIYKLLPILFPYNDIRVRLANMPLPIGVDTTTGHLIRWSESESTSCDFLAMPVCRETPTIITHWNHSRLYQILTSTHLSAGQIEQYHEPLFIHHICKYWIISTNSIQHCHTTPFFTTPHSYSFRHNLRTIPAVALITIPPQTTLTCDQFSISSSPPTSERLFSLVDSSFSNTSYDNFDLHQYLRNSSQWPKLPYISNDLQNLLHFITTPLISPPQLPTTQIHHQSLLYMMAVLRAITILLLLFLFYSHFLRKPSLPSFHFKLPAAAAATPL